MPDPFALARFVDAQASVYAAALAELRAGAKASHWMWFVFPQHRALGRSAMALRFGIGSAAEALAYWRHPVLGARLRQCCEALLALQGRTAQQVLGSTDALKLRSSMTLFAQAVPDEPLFQRVLDHYYGGVPDPRTLEFLA